MNKYKRWTEDENLKLINRIKINYQLEEIANELERSKYAIIKQIEKLLLQKNINCQNIYEDIILNLTKDTFKSEYIIENDELLKNDNVPQIEDNQLTIIVDNNINNEIHFILDEIIDEIEETNHLNDEQMKCYNLVKNKKNLFITGGGGCHAINTEILMYDGTIKLVQNININDLIMGDDNKPRKVLKLIRGEEMMYEISNNYNDSYIVNENHILCLKKSDNRIINNNSIVEILVKDFLNLPENQQKDLKEYKMGVEFPEIELPLDPYIIGIWLGSKTMNLHNSQIMLRDTVIINYFKENLPKYKCNLEYINGQKYRIKENYGYFTNILKKFNLINNKYIPYVYKCNSRINRLKILAGLIDSNGYLNNKSIEFNQSISDKELINDIIYLCRSLGLSCYKDKFSLKIIISCDIPILSYKKKMIPKQIIKETPLSNIIIRKMNINRYYGFQLDGNHRYLMGNFIVTHNCGKSTALKSIIKMLKRKKYNIGITSSTGSSATLINGTTLHSFLNIGLANKSATELYEKLKFQSNKSNYKKLKKLDVLIIDEISMIDDVLFNKIAGYLSLIKEIKKPFGRIQLIFCGDFYQLPPINNDYCFKSKIWDMLKIQIIELKQMMRQQNDYEFQELLNNIKLNNITDEVYNKLLTLKNNKFKNIKIIPTKLYSKNVDINKINNEEFNQLVNTTNAKIYTYEIKYDNNSNEISKYIKNSNIEKKIELCIGAQIMLTYNVDIINNLVNGTRGIVKKLYNNYIIIETINGNEYQIEYVKFTHDLDENITFNYMPIKLAYAISIHRSQGMTIDFIEIDLGNSIFTYGMAYVALSRAKTLNSIILSKLSRNAFKINKDVIEFYKKINN